MAYADTPEAAMAIMKARMEVKNPDTINSPIPTTPTSSLENMITPLKQCKGNLAENQPPNLFKAIIDLEDIEVSSSKANTFGSRRRTV